MWRNLQQNQDQAGTVISCEETTEGGRIKDKLWEFYNWEWLNVAVVYKHTEIEKRAGKKKCLVHDGMMGSLPGAWA